MPLKRLLLPKLHALLPKKPSDLKLKELRLKESLLRRKLPN